jgi:hypothetical protein
MVRHRVPGVFGNRTAHFFRVYSGHSFGRILSLVCEPSDDEAQGRVEASHGSFTPRKTILKYRVTKSDFEPPEITVAALIVTETRHTLAA